MVKLDIKIYPDKILRKKCASVRNIGDKEQRLAFDMVETMRGANGVGLAAPQVGIARRIIVIEGIENKTKGPALVLFNPRIVKKHGRCSFCEGCLSVPEIMNDIVRPEFIVVEALDIEGKAMKIDTGGLLARVLQHEIDHLDGILFVDRVGFLKRKKILKQISPKICMEL